MRAFGMAASLTALLSLASADSLRNQVEAASKAVDRFVMAKDAKSLKNYMKAWVTPDYRYVSGATVMSLDQVCSRDAYEFARVKNIIKVETKILRIRERGGAATVTVANHLVESFPSRDGKVHTADYTSTHQDDYVLLNHKWKARRSTRIKLTATVDGRPAQIPPNKPRP